jgi:hypothetical protein
MPTATTTQAGREVLTPEARKIMNDRERARTQDEAKRADTKTPLAKAAFEMEELFPEKAAPAITAEPKQRAVTMQIVAVLNGFTVNVSFDGTIQQLPGAIERLKALGATPTVSAPAAPIAAPDDLPEGWKLCQKHHAPMRPRNKQNANWHSHNVGTKDNPLWCKGYRGSDSPGYEVE